jgi:hypothetical protein
MKICYQEKNFREKSLIIIDQANEIIEEYRDDGLSLTLRQLYYQFVARDLLANKQSEYNRLGSIISDARLSGLVDWDAIVDRTRNIKSNSHWKDPGEIIEAATDGFMLDHWENQNYRVECWIEKEALIGVIEQSCSSLDITYFACRGYVSQSELWRAAMRFRKYQNAGLDTVIIHLGDHDPSGLDMTRDIRERLRLFGASTKVERVALNMDQIDEYNPPTNPAKLTDSRANAYINEYGFHSWELDALEPRVLRNLIEKNVESYIDYSAFETVIDQEDEYKEILSRVKNNWQTL